VFFGRAAIIDGDTIEVSSRRIRLAGIDAPEDEIRCSRHGKPWNCGDDSTAELRRLTEGREVGCVSIYCDPHGRYVAICLMDGRDIAEEMVRGGWAVDWPKYSNGRYAPVQAEAQQAGRGLWAEGVELPSALKERMASTLDVRRYRCEPR
jgi:endonuclease YncB( thermonuclease family)